MKGTESNSNLTIVHVQQNYFPNVPFFLFLLSFPIEAVNFRTWLFD